MAMLGFDLYSLATRIWIFALAALFLGSDSRPWRAGQFRPAAFMGIGGYTAGLPAHASA
jgi:hypothetical protein